MATYLRDDTDLPPLMWYDSLSSDGKQVMLSLQKKYAKMREQILMTQMKKELFSQDPREYYKFLYSRQFKAEPPSSSRQRFCTSQAQHYEDSSLRQPVYSQRTNTNHRENTQIQPITDESIAIKQEPPSPFISEQFHRTTYDVHDISDHHLDLRERSNSQTPSLVNYTVSRIGIQTTDSVLNSHHMSRLGASDRDLQRREDRKRKAEIFSRNFDMTKQRKQACSTTTNITQDYVLGTGNRCEYNQCTSVSSQNSLQSRHCIFPETSFTLGFSAEECDIIPVPPVHISLEADASKEDFDKDLYEASQDLFVSTQEQHNTRDNDQANCVSDKNPSSRQSLQHQRQDQEVHILNQDQFYGMRLNNDPQLKVLEHHQNKVLVDKPNHSNTDYQNLHECNLQKHHHQNFIQPRKPNKLKTSEQILQQDQQHSFLKEHHPQIQRHRDVLANDQRTSLGSHENQTGSHQQTAQCQPKMDSFLQKPPCSVAKKLEFNQQIRLIKDIQNPNHNTGKTDSTEKKKIPKFGKPKKAVVEKETTSINEEIICKDAGLVDVGDLSDIEKEQIRDNILQSKTVCLALVFSSETTLIRCFQPTNLQLKYVAIKISQGDHTFSKDQSTLLFSFTSEDDSYLKWFKYLVSSLMDARHIEKIALNAKQLCSTLFGLLTDTEDKGYNWMVLDPLVGAWLLNSDKSPKCLQDVMKESGIKKAINVMQGGLRNLDSDLNLLHEMMTMMKPRLKSQDLWQLFYKIETPLIPILAQLEKQKLLVDTDTFINFSNVLKKKLKKLEEKAYASVGHSFCISSHPQLRQVLYEELRLDEKLPAKSKIAKTSVAHQKSTSEVTLTQLKDTHSLPAIVLEYRQLQKLKSTYVDGMMSCVKKGFLSTHWDQTAAATGRLTSSQPNIQAIPKVPVTITEYEDNFIIGKDNDKSIEIYAREPFISHKGHLLLAADFQQIELRLLAHLADDHVLLDIFNNQDGHDIFIKLTSQWLGKPVSDIIPSEREQTKRIVYSVMYGVGKEKLADYLKVSPDSAKSIMMSFLMKFPAVNSFTKKCVDFCQQNGFTRTIFNRKRLIPHINHSSHQLRAQAGRQAVNFCVQGSAADLCKAAMLHVQDQLAKHSLSENARLLAQIHDELLWEVEEEHLDKVKDIVKMIMEDSVSLCGDMAELRVPIRVSLSVGTSWAHLQPCQ